MRLNKVILSPPVAIGAGSGGYTEDWAVVEIDASKLNGRDYHFPGNVLDLSGTKFSQDEFTSRMNSKSSPEDFQFTYPSCGKLLLHDTIPTEEMCQPMMVMKRGTGTGMTIGCANNIKSYKATRYECLNGESKLVSVSKEWPVVPYDTNSGCFSDGGDSGAVVVDGKGRIGGILTGGAGFDAEDVSYVTPVSFILDRIHELGLRNPNVNLQHQLVGTESVGESH